MPSDIVLDPVGGSGPYTDPGTCVWEWREQVRQWFVVEKHCNAPYEPDPPENDGEYDLQRVNHLCALPKPGQKKSLRKGPA